MQYDHLPSSPTQATADGFSRSQVLAWEQAARSACETIDSEAAGVNAASVTLPGETDGAVSLLCGVVDEIAAEYGLAVAFKLDRDALTARFTREVPSVPDSERPHKTLRIR